MDRLATAQTNRLAGHLASIRSSRVHRLAKWDRPVDSTADALVGTALVRALRTKPYARALAPKADR
jgi:hypothetical protein